MLKLLSATPSASNWEEHKSHTRLRMHNTEAGVSTDSKSSTKKPYAGKVRIVLEEKDTPFESITEVPWDSTTSIPQYSPIEKHTVLILEPGASWRTPMLSQDIHERLFAKKVEVVADGMCDALVYYSLRSREQKRRRAQSARHGRFPEYPWGTRYPDLKRYLNKLGERQSFKDTMPAGQKIKDNV
ncbi:uncharacterized protein K444DRAFT_666006 [Hyaloscypha bicolor E]|uniref:Uncharacterized protein n=1 Tax=Hyaloscypha bicolor E TaxID=1095630 RepID=A0A2J6T032_9HELO|nr:uncharacterized protein K444DRAFT_666006 [Hyaloscypha bicolor E]PMD56374.1 hypothetical protein K444DRAFT_666006 [Hyaloscypha bicolor E]